MEKYDWFMAILGALVGAVLVVVALKLVDLEIVKRSFIEDCKRGIKVECGCKE